MAMSTGLPSMMSVCPDDTAHESRFVDDFEAWPPDLSFYVEIGSIFDIGGRVGSFPDLDDAILDQVAKICKHDWQWSWDEYSTFAPDTNGRSTMPDGTRVSVDDVRRRLWIHFDSKDDAMLSRITVVDLRNARHADSGRMPKGTGPTIG